MKQLLKFSLIFAIAASGLIFTACEGEDGDPGAAGADGEKGDKGDTGDTGANGVGFDETTQYGNIVVRYKGTRIDDVAFDQTVDFKFSPTGPDAANTSSVRDYEYEGGETETRFDITRYSSVLVAAGEGSSNFVDFYYYTNSDGEKYTELYTNVAIVSDDMKFFTLNQYFESNDAEAVTEYNFNSVTGELTFKFDAVIPAENNNTNHELEISADVKVKVLRSIDSVE